MAQPYTINISSSNPISVNITQLDDIPITYDTNPLSNIQYYNEELLTPEESNETEETLFSRITSRLGLDALSDDEDDLESLSDFVTLSDLRLNTQVLICPQHLIDNEEVCSICLNKYKKNDIVRKLPCNHMFHIQCVDKSFEYRKNCPYCQTSVIQIEEYDDPYVTDSSE